MFDLTPLYRTGVGFDRLAKMLDEINIEVKENALSVTGRKAEREDKPQYLHQGIAARNFERRFQLADHVEVTGATMENGLLHVDLKREIPEAMKPRTIAIKNGNGSTKLIEDKKAA